MTPPPDATTAEPTGTPLGYADWASQWGAETPPGSPTSWVGLALLLGAIGALGVFVSWYIVIAILAIVVSVILHEAGHFIAAKRSGMKVTEAFVGFGPRIWSFRRGETEYGIKAIWAGAYVRIIGMHNLEEVDAADEARTYRSKNYSRRLATILAGPGMNILLAFFLLTGYYAAVGSTDNAVWPLKEIVPGSAAERAGLVPGDQIVAIDGVLTPTYEEFQQVIRRAGTGTVTIDYERDDQPRSVSVPLGWRVGASAAAQSALLLPNDIVQTVNGSPVESYEAFRAALRASGPVKVVVLRGDYVYELPMTGPIELPADGAMGFLGVRPIPTSERPQLSYSLPGAAVHAGQVMGEIIRLSGSGLARFFSTDGLSRYGRDLGTAVGTGGEPKPLHPADGAPPGAKPNTSTVSDDRPNSIIGGTQALGAGLEHGGLAAFAFILAVINLSLGVLNLLPLLPFDGGHATVATYERLRSRRGSEYRVDMAKLMPITYAVVLLVVIFGLTSMFLDIRSPVSP